MRAFSTCSPGLRRCTSKALFLLLSALLLSYMRCVVPVAASAQGFKLHDHLATKASACLLGQLVLSSLCTVSILIKLICETASTAECYQHQMEPFMSHRQNILLSAPYRLRIPTECASRMLPPCLNCQTPLAMSRSSCGCCHATGADGEVNLLVTAYHQSGYVCCCYLGVFCEGGLESVQA